jgi:hypothetical protein
MRHPADKGVFRHPLGESYFTIGERQSRPLPTRRTDAELLGKQADKREPQRRPVGVESVVLRSRRLKFWRLTPTPLAGGTFRRCFAPLGGIWHDPVL